MKSAIVVCVTDSSLYISFSISPRFLVISIILALLCRPTFFCSTENDNDDFTAAYIQFHSLATVKVTAN